VRTLARSLPQRIIGALLMASSVSQLFGGPGDLPTWLTSGYTFLTRPEVAAFAQQNAGLTFNILLGLTGLFVFFGRNPFARRDRSRPRLRLDSCAVVPQKVSNAATGEIHGTPMFALARFANDPEGEPTSRSSANKVVAHVTYCDAQGRPLYPRMVGRWGDSTEVNRGGKLPEISQMDFPPNGLPLKVDIAIKYLRERDAYGWNDDSDQNSEVRGRRDFRYKLPPGAYEIRVDLRGLNVRATYWLALTNPGQNKPLELTPSQTRLGVRRIIPRWVLS